jgi:hypothetical protein
MLSGLVAADKANRLDPRIIAQVVDCLWAAMNDADDSRGYACFFGELDEHGRCARVTFGRLDEQGVAAGDGDRKGPKRDHGWMAGEEVSNRKSQHIHRQWSYPES